MLTNLLLFSKGYIIIFIFLMVIGVLTNAKVTPKYIFIMGVLFTFSLSVIAFATIPHSSDDLTRYFYWIDAMKGKNLKFAYTESPFKATIVSNMLLYFVSIVGSKHLLPAITIAIEGMCILYIIISEKKLHNASTRLIISYVLVCIGISGLYISISGIRFNLAASIATVVIYNDFIKDKKGITTIIGYAILPSIHMGTLIIIVVRLLSLIKISRKFKILIVAIPVLLVVFKLFFETITTSYIQLVLEKIDMYQGVVIAGESYKRNIGYFLFNLLFFIEIKIINYYHLKSGNIKINSFKELNFLNYLEIFSLFSIGTYFVIPELFYRSTTIFAMSALPVFALYKKCGKRKFSIFIYVLYVVSIIIFFSYEYILYYRNWILL